MYRDLVQVKTSADEPSIPAGGVRKYGPFTLFNTRSFLIRLRASLVSADTELKVYLSVDFSDSGGDSACPTKPDINSATAWTLIHSNDLLTAAEPLIYEKCQTAAEWLRLDVCAGPDNDLDDLDIVLAKQAWR